MKEEGEKETNLLILRLPSIEYTPVLQAFVVTQHFLAFVAGVSKQRRKGIPGMREA